MPIFSFWTLYGEEYPRQLFNWGVEDALNNIDEFDKILSN